MADGDLTLETVEAALAGERELTLYGKPYACRLRAREREGFEAAQRDGFVRVIGRPNLRQAWWLWCAVHQRPWIGLHVGGRRAAVGIDMGPARRTMTMDELRVLFPAASWKTWSSALACSQGMSTDAATCLARMSVETLHTPVLAR